MKILVSAIVPVYNSEKYLGECIESLRNQTLKDIEMIFINDGSTDNSLEILRKYEKIDNRIKVINQENKGPSAARNLGIDYAKGEYISFIDSDDWIDIDMYKDMYELVKCEEYDAAICDMKMVSRNSELYVQGISSSLNKYNRADIEEKIFKELLSNSQFNSMANKLYKTSIIKKNNIKLDNNIYYAEDWHFNMQFFIVSKSAAYINKVFYYYRRGHESSSSSYKDDTFDKVGLWIYRMRKKYSNELNLNKFLAVNDLYMVIIHCIVSEFKRKDISLKIKVDRIRNIINSLETKEVIENIEIGKLSIKDKILYNSIKSKNIVNLYFYVKLARVKSALNTVLINS